MGAFDQGSRRPLLVLSARAKAGIEAAISGWYFYQMPAREKAWCGYGIVGALASFSVFGFSIPGARRAWTAWRA